MTDLQSRLSRQRSQYREVGADAAAAKDVLISKERELQRAKEAVEIARAEKLKVLRHADHDGHHHIALV